MPKVTALGNRFKQNPRTEGQQYGAIESIHTSLWPLNYQLLVPNGSATVAAASLTDSGEGARQTQTALSSLKMEHEVSRHGKEMDDLCMP